MDLEQQIKDLPPTVLALIAIGVIIVMLFLLNPPHTICDSQTVTIKKSQEGLLFPQKVGNYTRPGRIQKALEICRFGNSSGACFEYFDLLRRAALAVKNSSSECTNQVLKIRISQYAKMEEYGQVRDEKDAAKMRDELANITYQEVSLKQVFFDGLEMMVQKAWGEAPPQPNAERFAWFQETEMNAFCHIRDVLIRDQGKEGFNQSVKAIYAKLPGEAPPKDLPSQGMNNATFVARRANLVMPEKEIYERSILSAPCDRFR